MFSKSDVIVTPLLVEVYRGAITQECLSLTTHYGMCIIQSVFFSVVSLYEVYEAVVAINAVITKRFLYNKTYVVVTKSAGFEPTLFFLIVEHLIVSLLFSRHSKIQSLYYD